MREIEEYGKRYDIACDVTRHASAQEAQNSHALLSTGARLYHTYHAFELVSLSGVSFALLRKLNTHAAQPAFMKMGFGYGHDSRHGAVYTGFRLP